MTVCVNDGYDVAPDVLRLPCPVRRIVDERGVQLQILSIQFLVTICTLLERGSRVRYDCLSSVSI